MDYTRLISDAWRVTWRYKYLWILGLFAAEGGGCSGTANFNTGSFRLPDSAGSAAGALTDAEQWMQAHWVFLAAVGVGLVAVGFVVFVISVMSSAGLIAGVDDAAAARPEARLGTVWHRGIACFWRLFGMWLLVGLIAAVVMAVLIGIVVVPIVLSARAGAHIGGVGVVAAVLIGIVMVFALIPAAIVLTIVMKWAARALVLENTGVTASLSRGWRLFRRNFGSSILVWLIGAVLSLGVGIALAIVAFVVAVPAGLLLAASWGDINPAVVAALGVLGAGALVAMLAVKAVWATYFGAYWTLAFRQLTAPQAPVSAAGGPGYEPLGGGPWAPPAATQHWADPQPYGRPPYEEGSVSAPAPPER